LEQGVGRRMEFREGVHEEAVVKDGSRQPRERERGDVRGSVKALSSHHLRIAHGPEKRMWRQ
jgi:hypothetical protein